MSSHEPRAPNPGMQRMAIRSTADAESFGRRRTAVLLATVLGLAFFFGCSSTGAPPQPESAAETGTPLRVGGNVLPPSLIEKPEPTYPEAARKDGVQGEVILEVGINAKGTVADIMVLKSSDARLEAAAEEAVRRWRYKPATRDGKPVSIYYTATVSFRLS